MCVCVNTYLCIHDGVNKLWVRQYLKYRVQRQFSKLLHSLLHLTGMSLPLSVGIFDYQRIAGPLYDNTIIITIIIIDINNNNRY